MLAFIIPMKAATAMPARLSSYRFRSPSWRDILVILRELQSPYFFDHPTRFTFTFQ